MDLGAYLQIASAVAVLGGFAGLVVMRESLTQVRDQNRDLRDEVADYQRRHDELEKNNNQLGADIAALQRVVTGEVHWLAIEDLLTHHHKVTQNDVSDIKGLLTQIRDRRS